MFKQWWEYRQAQLEQRGQLIDSEVAKLDKTIENVMDRLVEAESTSVIKAYENRIKKLETNRCVLVEKSSQSLRPFDAALRTALDFISNPHKLWASGKLDDRRVVLKLVFPGGIHYHRNTGLRTIKIPYPSKC